MGSKHYTIGKFIGITLYSLIMTAFLGSLVFLLFKDLTLKTTSLIFALFWLNSFYIVFMHKEGKKDEGS